MTSPLETIDELQVKVSELSLALTKCIETNASDIDKGVMLGTLAQQLPDISLKMLIAVGLLKRKELTPANDGPY